MPQFAIRQGNTGRPLSVLLKNQDGSDVAVPLGTTVTFKMVHRQTGHTVTGAATLSDNPFTQTSNNQVTFPFSNPSDTAQTGLYDAEWLLVYPGGGTETFPTHRRGVLGYEIEVVPA